MTASEQYIRAFDEALAEWRRMQPQRQERQREAKPKPQSAPKPTRLVGGCLLYRIA